LPAALVHTRGSSNLTLFLSTLSGAKLAYPLTSLTIHPSLLRPVRSGRHELPPRAGEPAFRPQEELAHTFKKEEKSVGALFSVLGLGVTLSPWLVLLAMVRHFLWIHQSPNYSPMAYKP
jgi:oligosaccharyltransferase complex subunit delta (ribophorin II)